MRLGATERSGKPSPPSFWFTVSAGCSILKLLSVQFWTAQLKGPPARSSTDTRIGTDSLLRSGGPFF
jgi:hypothetical protein